mmetsp:Transcript_68084/g.162499  ORF Transcript_68084/g.162499 Transcript_68084/m.162499 type:complete len:269 (+) Transcript_68084:38-844(+)
MPIKDIHIAKLCGQACQHAWPCGSHVPEPDLQHVGHRDHRCVNHGAWPVCVGGKHGRRAHVCWAHQHKVRDVGLGPVLAEYAEHVVDNLRSQGMAHHHHRLPRHGRSRLDVALETRQQLRHVEQVTPPAPIIVEGGHVHIRRQVLDQSVPKKNRRDVGLHSRVQRADALEALHRKDLHAVVPIAGTHCFHLVCANGSLPLQPKTLYDMGSLGQLADADEQQAPLLVAVAVVAKKSMAASLRCSHKSAGCQSMHANNCPHSLFDISRHL